MLEKYTNVTIHIIRKPVSIRAHVHFYNSSTTYKDIRYKV